MWNSQSGFDEFGNPRGTAFDLGAADDERLQGEKILLYVAYIRERYDWHEAQKAVAERHLQMDIMMAPATGVCVLNESILSQYSQLWYVSDAKASLTPQQVTMIVDYVKAGNGLLIWADNEPFYADANLLARQLIGTEFSGNKSGDKIMGMGERLRPGVFIEHPLTQGVNQLYEGITICTIAPTKDLTLLAQSHDGQMCMACFERDNQRIVLDTGFTKLSPGSFQQTAGTARYFRNIAFWLAKGTRNFKYTQFTPGRGSLATINPGSTSERYKYPVTQPTTLNYILQWEGIATLGLTVQNPQGQTVADTQSSKSPLRVEVPASQSGDWVCWVKGIQISQANFPYVLTLATQTGAKDGFEQVQPLTTRSKAAQSGANLYTKPWGSTHPGCLIILLDQSGSMKERFGGGQIGAGQRKADMVATVLNSLLNDLIRSNMVGDKIKPRADIAVLAYEGTSVRNALSGVLTQNSFVTLPELLANPLRVERRVRREMDMSNQIVEIPEEFTLWVEPQLGTVTPMCAALRKAAELADEWACNHPDNYPPVIINVTDGASTDGDPLPIADQLCRVGTNYGRALLFNCHISHLPGVTVQFPSQENQVPRANEGLAQQLFAMSSIIPGPARQGILSQAGIDLPAGARGFIFNGDAGSVKQMFYFATVPAAQFDPNM